MEIDIDIILNGNACQYDRASKSDALHNTQQAKPYSCVRAPSHIRVEALLKILP